MKIVLGKLYIEWAEMLSAGVSSNMLRFASQNQSTNWIFINDPSDKRKSLIEYAALKDKYKELVIRKYGDPFEAVKSKILEPYITGKPEDLDFLTTYRLPNGKYIPKPTLERYLTAAKVLHFLSIMADKKKILTIGIPDMKIFWEMVVNYIDQSNASLPANVKRLQAKLSDYRKEGPQCIISNHFLNNRASKVVDQVAESFLLTLIGNPNRPDDVLVCDLYNQWARSMGLPTICSTTVWNYRKRNEMVITMTREGKKAWTDKYHRVIHRSRPSIPLALINSDDNDLDLYFLDDKGGKKNYYKRVKAIVITDCYNDYPLGWAVGEEVTNDLVREAYANAIDHVYRMTGSYHIWHQIQADNWSKKDLLPWYEKQAIFIKSETGSSRTRRIESFFNHEWHRVIGRLPNYTGHNITRGISVNPEALESRKKTFPTLDKAPALMSMIIEELRQRPSKTGDMTVQQQWLTAWSQVQEPQRRQLSDVNQLMLFGRRHSHKNTITNKGIILGQNGQRIVYDVPVKEYQLHVGRQLNIAYNPYDPTKILAYSDDESIRIICPVYEKYRDAVIDMMPGDRARLNARIGENKEVPLRAYQTGVLHLENLQGKGINMDAVLLTGNMTKELQHVAQERMLIEAVTGREIPESEAAPFEDDLNEKIHNSYDPNSEY